MAKCNRNRLHAQLVYKRVESKQKLVLAVCILLATSTILLSLPHILIRGKFDIVHTSPYLSQTQPIRGENHIFFIEPSCTHKDFHPPNNTGLLLNPRQACSIESTAKTNPNTSVYILYTCPVQEDHIEASSVFVIQLFNYPNLRFYQIHLDEYFQETPLEIFYESGGWNTSLWPREHASDVLRYLTLWKYGGTYLNLNTIVIRSLADLGTNFAAAEGKTVIGSYVLNFGIDQIGRDVAASCLEQLSTEFRGDILGRNAVINHVIKRMCRTNRTLWMTADRCFGFTVHEKETFFPIFFSQAELLFDQSKRNTTMELIQGSHAVHTWNHVGTEHHVVVGSLQPYALLAQEFCPEIYHNCGPTF